MDKVLADTLSRHLAMYNLEHGDTLTKQDLEGWGQVSIGFQPLGRKMLSEQRSLPARLL
jgi:hypothetical protein